MVAEDGAPGLPGSAFATHYRRCGWEQRFSRSPVEMGASTVGQPDGTLDFRVPLSSRDEQVEQDLAPPVLIYHNKLARAATRQPGCDCQSDRLDANGIRVAGTQ